MTLSRKLSQVGERTGRAGACSRVCARACTHTHTHTHRVTSSGISLGLFVRQTADSIPFLLFPSCGSWISPSPIRALTSCL